MYNSNSFLCGSLNVLLKVLYIQVVYNIIVLPFTDERVKSSSGPPSLKDLSVKSGAGLSGSMIQYQLKFHGFLFIWFEDFLQSFKNEIFFRVIDFLFNYKSTLVFYYLP